MKRALDQVVDALDIETFVLCGDEEEARQIGERLLAELNLPHGDIVFLEFNGCGARLRLRSYLHRPGQGYPWLSPQEES